MQLLREMCHEYRVIKIEVNVFSYQLGSRPANNIELIFGKGEASKQMKTVISLYPTGILTYNSFILLS